MAPPLLCHICQQQGFDRNASLALHYYQAHQAVFCCQYCNHQFCSLQERDVHVNKNHASPAAFCCIFCDVRSRQKKELTHHQRENHPVAMKDCICAKCEILLPDKECLNIHKDFCRGKQQQPDELRARHRSTSESRSHHSSTPNQQLKNESAAFSCPYCPQQFGSRDDHCRHLIFAHQAGVMCSYCNHHLIAPPGDQAASLKVFKEHLERDHKIARHWTCIYCGFSFNDRQALVEHHENSRHRILSCHLCSALMPSLTASLLHKEFQHKFSVDASTSDHHPGNNTPAPLEGLCLCCFRRYPLGNLRQHLLQHAEQECEWISCNEHFDFIQHPIDFDKHAACFEKEAKRFVAYVAGDKSTFSLCQCGFCASSQQQLSRHHGWCHKEMSCKSCKETEFGFVGMKRHMCMVSNGNAAAKVQHGSSAAANGQHEQGSAASPMQRKESVGTPRNLRSGCLNEHGSSPAQPPLPSVPQTVTSDAASSAIGLELPDSPEEITIKEEQESVLAAQSNGGEAASKIKSTPAQNKKIQEQPRPRRDSSSNSTASSNDHGKKKKTTPASAAKKDTTKNGPETKKTPTSEKQTPKRPVVQSKAASSESSSSSSSDSDDELPARATRPKPQIQAPKVQKRPVAPPQESSSSSSTSTSSDEDEPAPKKSKSVSNKNTATDGRPKIASVFSVKETDPPAKRTSANSGVLKTPPVRQNPFVAAAAQKESAEAPNRQTKRKTMEELANLEYVCTLCNQASVYRANVIRHLEIIHRIRLDMCSEFCQCRERPKVIIDDQEGDQEEQRPSTRSIGVEAKKACPDCKLWGKKVQSMEKIFNKMSSQIEKAKKMLGEDQN